MIGTRIHCSPAYGRDYKTEEEARKGWDNGDDFIMEGMRSGYINKRDAEDFGVPTGEINIRFSQKTEVVVITGLKDNPNS